MVVHGGRAAVSQQLTQSGQTAVKDAVLIQAFPDFIQGNQPGEQLHLLHLRQIPREGLIKVIVRVDQAGIHKAAVGTDFLVCLPGFLSNIGDDTVLDQNVLVFQNTVLVIDGDDGQGVFYKQGAHDSFSSRLC